LTLSLLAGCAQQQNKEVDDLLGQLDKPSHSRTHKSAESWAQSAMRNTQDNIYDPESYSGRECTLRVSLEPSGVVNSVNAEGGDPALCQVVIAAVKGTKYPPLPAELQKQKSII
ncbi:MAG: cell envelope integrity protein TolA, partial [Enterobacteriaceae bacterium]